MNFQRPFKVYTAASNLEAHLIVEILSAQDIEAIAVEDQSGVSLWEFGTISQFHQPNVWVDQSDAERAARVIVEFEDHRAEREQTPAGPGDEILAPCKTCGQTSPFSAAMNGSTQHCPHCRAYVDVGEIPWSSEGHAC